MFNRSLGSGGHAMLYGMRRAWAGRRVPSGGTVPFGGWNHVIVSPANSTQNNFLVSCVSYVVLNLKRLEQFESDFIEHDGLGEVCGIDSVGRFGADVRA